jgi:hypothetical protein
MRRGQQAACVLNLVVLDEETGETVIAAGGAGGRHGCAQLGSAGRGDCSRRSRRGMDVRSWGLWAEHRRE